MTNEDVLTMTRSLCLNYKDRPVRTSQDTENLFYKPESSRDSLNTTTVSRMWSLDHWSAYDLTVCICLIRIPHQRAVVVVVINTIVIIIVVTHIAYEREKLHIQYFISLDELGPLGLKSNFVWYMYAYHLITSNQFVWVPNLTTSVQYTWVSSAL